jgi:hypothetical protein
VPVSQTTLGAGFHSHHMKLGKAFPLRIVSWSWVLEIPSPT